jgi:hypothetical protein
MLVQEIKENPFIQVYIWLEKGLRLDGATLSLFIAFSLFKYSVAGQIYSHATCL